MENVRLEGQAWPVYLLGSHLHYHRKAVSLGEIKYESWNLGLGSVERSFLQAWGDFYQLKTLQHIDEFLTPQKLQWHLPQTELFLNGNFTLNHQELCRKFPDCFHQASLGDCDFSELGLRLFHLSRFEPLKSEHLKQDLSVEVSSTLQEMSECIQQKFQGFSAPESLDKEFLSFWQMVQYFYGLAPTKEPTEMGLIFGLISLLSPRYTLNEQALFRALKQETEAKGCFTPEVQQQGIKVFKLNTQELYPQQTFRAVTLSVSLKKPTQKDFWELYPSSFILGGSYPFVAVKHLETKLEFVFPFSFQEKKQEDFVLKEAQDHAQQYCQARGLGIDSFQYVPVAYEWRDHREKSKAPLKVSELFNHFSFLPQSELGLLSVLSRLNYYDVSLF